MSFCSDPTLWDRIHAPEMCGLSGREVARRLKAEYPRIGKSTVNDYRRSPRPDGGQGGPAASEPAREFRENLADGTATLAFSTDRIVKTLDDALRAADVDESVWYAERWEVSDWSVPMNRKNGQRVETLATPAGPTQTVAWNPSTAMQTQQYRVKVFLKRLLPLSLKVATDAIYERLARHAPKYPPLPARGSRLVGESYLGVVSVVDAHFGKLSWAKETGEDYDLKIAENLFRNAVDDLTDDVAGRNVSHWLVPIGSDFYHIDNRANSTLSGTPQDVDGRYAKVIEAGEMAVIWAIERLAQTAPVSVLWTPGNHDATTSYHLARVVAAWFRQCARVAVDCSPSPRKYFHWHGTLLGLTHGDQEKPQSLPAIMATERPKEWAASTCREWLLGHHHRSRQWQTQPVETYEGTTVRVLRSLAGCDAWHHKRGFINPHGRAAELYLYGAKRGYAGHAVAPARLEGVA